MCGIIAAIAQRNVVPLLLKGLKKLEYRGYDSAGIALLDQHQCIQRRRTVGKVAQLEKAIVPEGLSGEVGIAHTRWATHGKPSEINAHPHMSGTDIAIVHNGIIENYLSLRHALQQAGYEFESETDTEIIAHLVDQQLKKTSNFLTAVQHTVKQLHGAFAIVFLYSQTPHQLIAARKGSPLVIGLGRNENFVASDQLALLSFTEKFIYLQEGDIAQLSNEKVIIYDNSGSEVKRPSHQSSTQDKLTDKGKYRHYMEKEIFEQPEAISAALEGRLIDDCIHSNIYKTLPEIQHVQIVACGTSYHAGLIARYWLENYVGLPCYVELASEYRYHQPPLASKTLFITLSQSGETADTLEALRLAKTQDYAATLTICNVAESAMVRESDFVLLTHAGPEIGVASTKAFTTQLTVLLILTGLLGRQHHWTEQQEKRWVEQLRQLPQLIEESLKSNDAIQQIARLFLNKTSALFIARGIHYPVALEGALKLKEISYIHAEAYPAGELKHGALALVDENMPVIALLPKNNLADKVRTTIQEVRARGGQMIVLTQDKKEHERLKDCDIILLPDCGEILSPILFTIPLQLLAYHVAVLKGTDVDQPRNLAKSVTVE